MNGNCDTCDVEANCAYQYKPCDCANYRKFRPKPIEQRVHITAKAGQVIQFPIKQAHGIGGKA